MTDADDPAILAVEFNRLVEKHASVAPGLISTRTVMSACGTILTAYLGSMPAGLRDDELYAFIDSLVSAVALKGASTDAEDAAAPRQ